MNLEIGGGPHPAHPDYMQFDAIDWHDRTGLQYTQGDAHQLPWQSNFFERVFCSNLLEHFPVEETTDLLTEWARVLIPGGVLELVVPDSIGILRDFFEGRNDWEHCSVRLLGGRDYEGNAHKACFTYCEWPAVMAPVHSLQLVWSERSHAGGGIHSRSIKL